jgi:hypothetical protein
VTTPPGRVARRSDVSAMVCDATWRPAFDQIGKPLVPFWIVTHFSSVIVSTE